MNRHEEGINAMWEEVEGNRSEPARRLSEEDRWKRFVEELRYKDHIVLSEFGIIDTSRDAMKDVYKGEHLTYDEYMQALFDSRHERRNCFEHCYYSNACCRFKGQICKMNKRVLFERIYISAILPDGEGYEGKEEHVWMDAEPFKEYWVGDCLAFEGEIYRYLKTGNGRQISFGIRKPYDIEKIGTYELPSDEELLKQTIDDLICESCVFRDHCYMGNCIANEKWRESMREALFAALKGKE